MTAIVSQGQGEGAHEASNKVGKNGAHLNRDKIEWNLSVPRIQARHENALYKSFEMSPLLICL